MSQSTRWGVAALAVAALACSDRSRASEGPQRAGSSGSGSGSAVGSGGDSTSTASMPQTTDSSGADAGGTTAADGGSVPDGRGDAAGAPDAGVAPLPNGVAALTCADLMRDASPVGVTQCAGLTPWEAPVFGYPGLTDTVTVVGSTAPHLPPQTIAFSLNSPGMWNAVRGKDGFIALLRFLPTEPALSWQYTLLCQFDEQGELREQLADLSTEVPSGEFIQHRILDAAARGGTTALLLEEQGASFSPNALSPQSTSIDRVALVVNGERLYDFGVSLDDPGGDPPAPNFTRDEPQHVALGSNGRIVLALRHRPGAGNAEDAQLRLVALGPNGEVLHDVVTPDRPGVIDLAVGSADEVLVLTRWYANDGTPPDRIDRYDSRLELLESWTPPDDVLVNAMDVQEGSHLALGGEQESTGWAQVLNLADFSPLWPTLALEHRVQLIDYTDSNELVVGGHSQTADAAWVMRYDADGTPAWPVPETSPTLPGTVARALSVQSNGHILVTGGFAFSLCE
ncbi:MAG: hypothetical protein OXT09_32085 [Myxococcales bacterium]|nr:hypothetical protein [Myxococcales bacterium]